MPKVMGRESCSARTKSLLIASPISLSALAPPASSTRNSGKAFCTPATAVSTGCTRSSAVLPAPFMSNWTSVVRLSVVTGDGCGS